MTGGSAVWSTRRKTVLLFEGSRAVVTGDVKAIVQTAIREYDTTIGQWKAFETKGTFPSPRLDACAVESEDGSKIILFGGAADVNVILNTIHILDVDSGQWTQGQPAPGARTQMACAYHSGLFIAFGGTSSKNQNEDLYSNQPIVYDVNKNQWVERYNPPGAIPAASDDSDGSTSDGSSADGGDSIESSPEEKSHMRVIIGAGVGAIVVMMVCAVVIGYLVQKRRRDRKAAERDARTTALLSDGEDHYSHRRRTIHKRAANANRGNSSNENNMVMTAAEHYAAAQAAAELRAARDAAMAAAIVTDGGNSGSVDGDRRANSWNSDTFSQVTASEYESTILMNVARTPRLSNATTVPAAGAGGAETVSMDPQTYYLHLLHQQRTMQARHPELHLVDNEAVMTAVGSVEIGLHQSDRVPRSPHSTPNEKNKAETLLGGNSSSTVGDRSPTTAASAEKAMSFVKRESSSSILSTSARRAPHSVVNPADSGLGILRKEGIVTPTA
ncbi:hypothetical protein BG015_010075 [Linnemannia schmuckeri]|uniref:Galactose oxidase n=1 Tax=Linnemannia schmuckeri TaxID=64567 RepID=A0A9P5V944_9FUNG|nr:hypothetical protein BG015_010075 [Linnemannia schmuckeri]